jgi:SulP family sulfate permease
VFDRTRPLWRYLETCGMNLARLRADWLGNVKGDLLAGMVVALALIPEAIAFSIIAGVGPKVGLYASCIACVIALTGGRPAMISAATSAMALVIVTLVRDHGLQYLLATTILTGVFQIVAGLLRLGDLMRFVSRSVMTGFVNALAILIFLAQLPELIGHGWQTYVLTTGGLAIIYLLPRVTKAVPSPLIAIILLTALSMLLGIQVRTVGDMGELPTELPVFLLPSVPLTPETLRIIVPTALTLTVVGLLESLMTASIVDELTDTPSNRRRECWGRRRQHRLRVVRRHGGLRHDRPVGHQREVGRPRAALHVVRGRLPAVPHPGARRLRAADPDGSLGRRDDHGVHRHL